MAEKNIKTSGLEGEDIWGDDAEDPDKEFAGMTDEEIKQQIKEIDRQMAINRKEITTLARRKQDYDPLIKENEERITKSNEMPYLVANIGEIIDVVEEEDKREGSGITTTKKKTIVEDENMMKKAVVLKASNRATMYLPGFGMIDPEGLRPGDIVACHKDTYNIVDRLPMDYDSRVKAMEVDERPVEEYSDIGGLDKQIEELVEAIVLPMQNKERFVKLGIRPPKGLLIHGPPGTGKTLMARACAAQTQATFLKLAGTNLVQMYIGDGARMVRDAFELAKEKSPCIIFIDEIDAVGAKRDSSGENSGREVHRTMLELLNALDGFTQNDDIKVIAATNRPDILDPALLRSGRLDRKIELPLPNEEARARIMQIHSRKMTVDKNDVNFEELARSTPEFNGAQLKAVCVEGGMTALRRGAKQLRHEDFIAGINEVQDKKKSTLNYYA